MEEKEEENVRKDWRRGEWRGGKKVPDARDPKDSQDMTGRTLAEISNKGDCGDHIQ